MSLLTQSAHAQAESRLALLIGNSAYRSSPLINPVNDVRLMESALKEAGFTVIKAENASIREMRRLVRDFGDRLKAAGGVGLFYFAGHGVQVRGENFLVSTDSDIRNEEEVADDAVNANVILDRMQSAGNRMNLIILDACRNNPFAVRSRTAASGLANINAPIGSLVAYATAPGSVASDGNGSNGLYTQHLARMIREPGLPVEEVFKRVRAAVRRDSNNLQTPWENTALEGQFYFKAPVQVVTPPPAPAPVAVRPSGPDSATMELALWESVKAATTVGELQAYLNRFPAGYFSDVARARIAAISRAASDRAATEQATADAALKLSAERVAAEAARKTEADRVAAQAAQAAQVASAERVAAEAAQKLASERAAKEAEQKIAAAEAAQKLAAERYKLESEQRLAAITPPRLPNQVADLSPLGSLRAGDVLGTLVLKDSLSGAKTNRTVFVQESDAERIVFSTGDVIAKDGRVLQVLVGDAVLRVESGALWTLPLKAGTSGTAKIKRVDVNYDAPGKLDWKAVETDGGRVSIVADVLYGFRPDPSFFSPTSRSSPMMGKWSALFSGKHPLAETSSTDLRSSAMGAGLGFGDKSNLVSSELKLR